MQANHHSQSPQSIVPLIRAETVRGVWQSNAYCIVLKQFTTGVWFSWSKSSPKSPLKHTHGNIRPSTYCCQTHLPEELSKRLENQVPERATHTLCSVSQNLNTWAITCGHVTKIWGFLFGASRIPREERSVLPRNTHPALIFCTAHWKGWTFLPRSSRQRTESLPKTVYTLFFFDHLVLW